MSHEAKAISETAVQRLLIVKGILGGIRLTQPAEPDYVALAKHILLAHDAAELAIAVIAQHLGKTGAKKTMFLMDYIGAIQDLHPVEGRDYFSDLNDVRNNLKHKGLFPDPKAWKRLGERTWMYVSAWCEKDLSLKLNELDQAELIRSLDVKGYYARAKEFHNAGKYSECLEHLAFACHHLFDSNQALRNLPVGIARAEDAIKLAAFGVHANDYLALQQFLPRIAAYSDEGPTIGWDQHEYGHAGNWNQINTGFCLNTFVDLALRIQDAEYIPGPLPFHAFYEYKITSLEDGVSIQHERKPGGLLDLAGPLPPLSVRVLNKGDSIRCQAIQRSSPMEFVFSQKTTITFYGGEDGLWGDIESSKIRITCIPRENILKLELFSDLKEIDYKP